MLDRDGANAFYLKTTTIDNAGHTFTYTGDRLVNLMRSWILTDIPGYSRQSDINDNTTTMQVAENKVVTLTFNKANPYNNIIWQKVESNGNITNMGVNKDPLTISKTYGGSGAYRLKYVLNAGTDAEDAIYTNSINVRFMAPINISFDPNGGSGLMTGMTKNFGDDFTVPACTFTPPSGKVFSGWIIDGDTTHSPDAVGNTLYTWKDHTVTPNWVPANGIIDRVDCFVTAPKAGELPSYEITLVNARRNTETTTSVSGSPGVYTYYEGVLWRDTTIKKNHRSNVAFVEGHIYEFSVPLIAPYGSKFNFEDNGNPITRIYVNGMPAEIWPDSEYASRCGIKYTFTDGSGLCESFISDTDPLTIELLQSGTARYSEAFVGKKINYSIKNVANGSYTLRVSKKNHVTRDYEITVDGAALPDIQLCPVGDISGDGRVTTKDYAMANAHAQKVSLITDPYKLKCGDVMKNDSKITTADAARINAAAQRIDPLW